MSVFKILTRRRKPCSRRRPCRWVARGWQAYMLRVGPCHWHVVTCRGYGTTLWGVNHEGIFVPWWPGLTWYGELLHVKKRQPKPAAEQPAHLAPMESDVLTRCMALVSHCASTKYDDGDARKPGWFTVRTRGSAWEVEVKDPDTASRLVVIQTTLDDALAMASMLLDAEEAPWEPDPWLAKSAAAARKK